MENVISSDFTACCANIESSNLMHLLSNAINMCRLSEFSKGPECLLPNNIPNDISTSEYIILWIIKVISAACKLNSSLEKNKSMLFGASSEKKNLKRNEKYVNKIKESSIKNEMTKSEYDKIYNNLIERKNKIQKILAISIDKTINNQDITKKYADFLVIIEEKLKELENTKIIINDSIDQNNNADGKNCIDKHKINVNNMKNKEYKNSYNIDDQNIKKRHRIDLKNNRITKLKDKPKNKEENRQPKIIDISKNDKDFNLSVRENDQKINPLTGENDIVYDIETIQRKAEVMDSSYKSVSISINRAITYHTRKGDSFEANTATCHEPVLCDENGNVTALVNRDLMLYINIAEEHEKINLNKYLYSKELLSIMTIINGALVFSPTEFLGLPSTIYGKRQAYIRSGISEGFLIKIIVDFAISFNSKSRIAEINSFGCNGVFITRQQIFKYINGTIRALKPVVELTRQILFKNTSTWHNDETVFLCLQSRNDENGESCRKKNYLWALVTGKHEELQGVVYLAGKTREADTFLKQFGFNKEQNEDILDEISIINIITDCYAGYTSGIQELEKLLGRKLNHGACYAHLRRYFLDALQQMGVKDIFFAICDGPASDFKERLEAEIVSSGKYVGPIARQLIFITFLIELILRLDREFTISSKQEIEETRRDLSSSLVEQLYENIDSLKDKLKSIQLVGERDGFPQYKGDKVVPWEKAIIYALNNKQYLMEFLNNGDIECTNNYAELVIRPCTRHRSNMEFLASDDGYRCYADLMTLIMTCLINKCNPYNYLHWVFANMKMRIEDYRLSTSKFTNTTKQICWLPGCKKDKDGNKLSMYSDDYECCFDKISCDGLDIFSYIKKLEEERPRIKKEFLEE